MSQLQHLISDEITLKSGYKSKDDQMILVGGKVVSYTDIAEAMLELWSSKKFPTAFIGKLWEVCQKKEFEPAFVTQLEIAGELKPFCEIIYHLYQNEERLYPRKKGKQGGNYLIAFLWDVLQAKEITQGILKQYRLVR